MYNVLIVDDDQFTLELLSEQLKSFGDFFTPIFADDGKKAVEVLEEQEISLLVTDLVMPGEFNGWALIEHLEENHPNIPTVVITGCEDQKKITELKDRVRHVFLKPVKVNQLVQVVTNILNEDITSGSLQGVSLASFLQLLELEGKTCLLEVATSPKNKGFLYINNGRLYDAIYGDYRRREAACHLIAMDNARFQIKALPKKKIRQRIDTEMMAIIMEAMQMKDELTTDKENIIAPKIPVEEAMEGHRPGKEQQRNQAGESISPSNLKETNVMALETILEDLRSIKGYKAGALMNFTGEILASDSIDDDLELSNVGAVFNDIFRSSHEAAGKVGLQVCNELTLKTPNGLIVMSCSGVDSPVHFHLLAVLDSDGNQALAKLQLDKMTPVIMAELT